MAEVQPAHFTQGACHTARGDRAVLDSLVSYEGVSGNTHLAVTAGTGMSVDVASGEAFIEGDFSSFDGMYHVLNDATKNVSIAASNPSNPRIDLVVAQVRDAQYTGVNNDWILTSVTGIPGAVPAAPALPSSSLLLAQVLVPAASSSSASFTITDLRVNWVSEASALVGEVTMWTSTGTPPKGWLRCDGSAVSRTRYARLFSVIGTSFGTGDGSTTFNLPDMRGRFPVGRNISDPDFDTMGETGGAKTHTHTSASHTHTSAAHTHPLSANGYARIGASGLTMLVGRTAQTFTSDVTASVTFSSSGGAVSNFGAALSGDTDSATPGATGSAAVTVNAANGVPPYAVLDYVIRS